MASFNRVMLMGNLTRDIELRYLPSGTAVSEFGLAVNEKRKGSDGVWVDDVNFFDITLFGRTAEVASEYLSKGSPIFIEGRLKYDTWEKDGQKRSKIKIIGERMQMIGGVSGNNSSGSDSQSATVRESTPPPQRYVNSNIDSVPPADPQPADPQPADAQPAASSPTPAPTSATPQDAQPTGSGPGYGEDEIPF